MLANSSCKPPMIEPRQGVVYPQDPLDCGSLRLVAHSVTVITFLGLQLMILLLSKLT